MTDVAADILWEPTADYLERSRVLRFMRRHSIATYGEFYRRSIEDIAWVWDAVVRDELELEWLRPYDQIVELSDGPAWPHCVFGGKLNYVVNAVERLARGVTASKLQVVGEGGDGATRSVPDAARV